MYYYCFFETIKPCADDQVFLDLKPRTDDQVFLDFKPRTDDQVFLDKFLGVVFLARVYDEQVFFQTIFLDKF